MVFELILKKVNEFISSQKEIENSELINDGLFISGEKRQGIFKKENFIILNESATQQKQKPKNKPQKPIYFIDGGSQNILTIQNFLISFNRIGYVKFLNEKENITKIFEFYSVIKIIPNNETNEIEYFVEIFIEKDSDAIIKAPINIKQTELEQKAPDINKVANIVRRFQELYLILKINKREKASIIVLDGSIQPKTDKEKELFQNIKEISQKNDNVILGISKTNSLITRKGCLVGNLLSQIAPKNKNWVYCGFPDNTGISLCFAKLNPKAKYVFMIDFIKSNNLNNQEIKKVLETLTIHSCDSVFLGYPYGLIKIDDFVRVTNNEKIYLKLKLESKTSNRTLLNSLKSNSDTHNILDTMKF